MDLCLGTVQFGMDYGVNNQKKPVLEQAIQMLDYATQNGITTIDTANAYGTAENVLGEFINSKTMPRSSLSIISKLKPNVLDGYSEKQYFDIIAENLFQTLRILKTDYLDGYLLHSARYVFNDEILYALSKIREAGYVNNIGVSIYEVDEAKKGIASNVVDLIQLPFSIFDQRMKNEGVFNIPEITSTEIHSRSAFLQGLILLNGANVPSFLPKAKPIVKKINEYCVKNNISKISLAINFVRKQKSINKLVFGVDNLQQLKEDIAIFNNPIEDLLIEEIAKEFVSLDTSIIMPSLWSKK